MHRRTPPEPGGHGHLSGEATAILTVDGLKAGYGDTPVLEGLSLHVEEGAIVAILGRNGVGKTALLRAIMGLIPCRSGRIALDGIDLTSLFAHQRARLGLDYVPQGREI